MRNPKCILLCQFARLALALGSGLAGGLPIGVAAAVADELPPPVLVGPADEAEFASPDPVLFA